MLVEQLIILILGILFIVFAFFPENPILKAVSGIIGAILVLGCWLVPSPTSNDKGTTLTPASGSIGTTSSIYTATRVTATPTTPAPANPFEADGHEIPSGVQKPTEWLSSTKTMYAAPQESNEVYIRLRPSTEAGDNISITRTIRKGSKVTVYAETSGYYFVFDEKSGQVGWVTKSKMEF